MNGTVIIKGEVFDLLPSYKEEGMEEIEGVTHRKFTGNVNNKQKRYSAYKV